jgi:hypothetical protein
LSSHQHLSLPNGLLPSGFSSKILYAYIFSMRATCPPHFILLELGWLVYSCCSHLEHRTSMKRFVSLQFLNVKTFGRIPWTGNQPVARPLPKTNTE